MLTNLLALLDEVGVLLGSYGAIIDGDMDGSGTSDFIDGLWNMISPPLVAASNGAGDSGGLGDILKDLGVLLAGL